MAHGKQAGFRSERLIERLIFAVQSFIRIEYEAFNITNQCWVYTICFKN